MRRLITTAMGLLVAAGVAVLAQPVAALACAGLIGSNGAVNLGRTTTLAAYDDGVEHYVTSFEFQGGGGEFGTLIPLPGVPTDVQRGGAWTLQRLQLETQPPAAAFAEARLAGALSADGAEVLQEVRIDALDITVLKGGGADVAVWAEEHGFRLSPDAPEVLEFYASRSPIFLAAVFDGEAAAARGQQAGDGTPVHLTIPTDNPWVQPEDRVSADVFLLTDDVPALLPGERDGLKLTHSAPATDGLLDDLRSDDGMAWVPETAWLSKLSIDSTASDMVYDLAIDASGNNDPSPVAAGLVPPSLPQIDDGESAALILLVMVALGAVMLVVISAGIRQMQTSR